jgi:hypothetical protein
MAWYGFRRPSVKRTGESRRRKLSPVQLTVYGMFAYMHCADYEENMRLYDMM